MKKTLLKALALGCVSSLMMAGSAMALSTDVTVTYTADNIVDTWYVQGEGVADNIGAGDNRANWTVADTETINLEIGETFSFVWEVTNAGAATPTNPAGFLAEIDFGSSTTNLYTDVTWEYAIRSDRSTMLTSDFDTNWTWNNVTSYAYNNGNLIDTVADQGGGTFGADDNQSIWYDVNGNNSVAGINGDASWIWSENNFSAATDEWLFIRAQVTPVPEPATMLLFGTGLVGLVGVSRRRRKQA